MEPIQVEVVPSRSGAPVLTRKHYTKLEWSARRQTLKLIWSICKLQGRKGIVNRAPAL